MNPRRLIDAPTKEALFSLVVILGAIVGVSIGLTIWLTNGGSDGGAEAEAEPPAVVEPTPAETTSETAATETGGAETTAAETGGAGTGEAEAVGGDPAAGKVVFTANCGGCHTLADAGTSGNVGPNLDDLQPAYDQVVTIVTDGRGAMPSFSGTLTEADIQNVAAYVSELAGA